MLKWFQVDSNSPHDPKISPIIRRRGQAGAGAIYLLWCYVAQHGKLQPGLAVRDDGGPRPLREAADECFFEGVDDLKVFLDDLADRQHLHGQLWADKGIIFLPAMWTRSNTYLKWKKGKAATRFESVDQVVAAVLDGTIVAKAGKPAATKGPKGRPTRQTKQTGQTQQDTLLGPGAGQVEGLVTLWNAERKPGPQVREITPDRRKQYGRALVVHPNLADWAKVIRHLNGEKWANAPGDGDHPTWRADLDWLTGSGKLGRYLEKLATLGGGRAADGRNAAKGTTGRKPGEFMNAVRGDRDDESK